MILREYLYVDSTVVRGVLAQLESGIAESETQTEQKRKATGGGIKGFAEHTQSWGGDITTAKSLGDALFPRLEDALESEGLLEDVSGHLSTPGAWESGAMRKAMTPGKIVRITAPGWLMDSRFIASILTSYAVVNRGLENMEILERVTAPTVPPKVKAKQPGGANGYEELPGEAAALEGLIQLGHIGGASGLQGAFLRGIAQVMRGMFRPGLHLTLTPEGEGAGSVTLRLQEGRQYLDTDPDVLFARYGVGAQEWTVVGTVGHHALPTPDLAQSSFMEGETIRRANFARYVTGLGTTLGNLGFADLAQEPDFSLVPWAVYRTIGKPDGPSADHHPV